MRAGRLYGALILTAALLGPTACGGPGAGAEFEVAIFSRALATSLDTVRLVIHPSYRACSAIKKSPRVNGIVETDVQIAQGMTTGTGQIDMIPADTYTVAAIGNSNGAPVAFGCQEGVVIQDGVRAHIALDLLPL
jgi:hypothetical protein